MSSAGTGIERGSGEQAGYPGRPPGRNGRRWWKGALTIALSAVAAAAIFIAGYAPRQQRQAVLASEARDEAHSIPPVNVAVVEQSPARAELLLPGTMQAVAEAPVMARASGYVKRRLADIGDTVEAGQVLAEIEAPELDQQIRQAVSAKEQAAAALEQAEAGLRLSTSNQRIAKVTADRWAGLAARGAVSRQENDNYQALLEAQNANVQASEKAIVAAKSNLAAMEASLARLNQLKNYQQVRAPFGGIVTVRNIEAGMLISEGSTLLYRVAQPGTLRVYVNVPQPDADAVRPGMTASLSLQGAVNSGWKGAVTRTAKALDPTTRTMLTEVQVANRDGKLLPGMFVMVGLSLAHSGSALLIPGDTLVVRSDGPQVALVGKGDVVHYRKVQLGRDLGTKLQVLAGLEAGDRVVVNPGDTAKEGARVRPVMPQQAGGGKRREEP